MWTKPGGNDAVLVKAQTTRLCLQLNKHVTGGVEEVQGDSLRLRSLETSAVFHLCKSTGKAIPSGLPRAPA